MAKNLTDTEIDEVLELGKWACEELNLGPHAYQALYSVAWDPTRNP